VRIGEASVDAMAEAAAIGVSQLEVYGQMLLAQARSGADALHVAWCPGFWGAKRHRYVGPPPGILETGLYVSTEIMPEIRSYQAQVAQPMVIGEPSDQALDIFATNMAAFDAALKTMTPGSRWGDVFAAVDAAVEGAGGAMFTLLNGRGLGNDGPLVIPASINPRADIEDDLILENTTFVLKPFLIVPEAPAQFARTHDVTWGDTVVITATGAQRLGTRIPEITVVNV